MAGLKDDEHQEKTRAVTFEGRRYLQDEFEKMGLEYVPSHANFVLVKVGSGDGKYSSLSCVKGSSCGPWLPTNCLIGFASPLAPWSRTGV